MLPSQLKECANEDHCRELKIGPIERYAFMWASISAHALETTTFGLPKEIFTTKTLDNYGN